MFKVNNKNTRTTDVIDEVVFLIFLWRYFTSFSSVSMAEFGQVHVCWEKAVTCSKLTPNKFYQY